MKLNLMPPRTELGQDFDRARVFTTGLSNGDVLGAISLMQA